jgi:hypothetical protein
MATATTHRSSLTEDQTREMLRLVKGADSVELKVTVPESDHRSAVRELGMDPLNAQIRQVFFFDTPDLDLNKAGVVARARRSQGKGGDTVIKLRPIEPDHLPKELRRSSSVNVEVDAMPGGFVCSASYKGTCGVDEPRDVAAGKATIRSLFSKGQRAFYREHAPEGLALDDLAVLGPITLLKGRFSIAELSQPMVAELWLYPDGSRILELSTKCEPSMAFQMATEVRLALAGRGISLSGEQQTKTKTALEHFAGVLKGA